MSVYVSCSARGKETAISAPEAPRHINIKTNQRKISFSALLLMQSCTKGWSSCKRQLRSRLNAIQSSIKLKSQTGSGEREIENFSWWAVWKLVHASLSGIFIQPLNTGRSNLHKNLHSLFECRRLQQPSHLPEADVEMDSPNLCIP